MQNLLHHIHRRKAHRKELAEYPHPDPRIRVLDRIMVIAATFGPMANIPQIIELYSSKDAGSLSFATWLLFAIMNLLWLFYGVVHRERTIMTSGISSILFQAPILIGIAIF